MAAPLIGVRKPAYLSFGTNTVRQMNRGKFERIQAKAKQQLDDDNGPAACDRETVALQIAWLNRQYLNKSVYFALLDAPGMGIAAFPPHEVDEVDEERKARIGGLIAAVETWLIAMGRCINIPFWDSGKFSDRDGTLSGTLCLAWAEGRLNKWPMYLTWQEDRMEAAWVPTTDDHDESAKMRKDGDGVCHWKHVLWLRAHKARFEELATA
ncbi:hypothetical protein N0V88_000702 [Collariella sp. IMI 366227]|nr:hypothetical protein N0V88_000702 [Collariella sp. IMI 366227]